MKKKIGIKGVDLKGLCSKDVIFKIRFDDATSFPKFLALENEDGDFILTHVEGASSVDIERIDKKIVAIETENSNLLSSVESMTSEISKLEGIITSLTERIAAIEGANEGPVVSATSRSKK